MSSQKSMSCVAFENKKGGLMGNQGKSKYKYNWTQRDRKCTADWSRKASWYVLMKDDSYSNVQHNVSTVRSFTVWRILQHTVRCLYFKDVDMGYVDVCSAYGEINIFPDIQISWKNIKRGIFLYVLIFLDVMDHLWFYLHGALTETSESIFNIESSKTFLLLVEGMFRWEKSHYGVSIWPAGSVSVACGKMGNMGNDGREREEHEVWRRRYNGFFEIVLNAPSSHKSHTKFAIPSRTSTQIFYLFGSLFQFLLWHFLSSVSFHKCIGDLSCFVDVVLTVFIVCRTVPVARRSLQIPDLYGKRTHTFWSKSGT